MPDAPWPFGESGEQSPADVTDAKAALSGLHVGVEWVIDPNRNALVSCQFGVHLDGIEAFITAPRGPELAPCGEPVCRGTTVTASGTAGPCR
jgi:hypothetical protein